MLLGASLGTFTSCGLDIPQEVPSSFETMTVERQDIEVPVRFSAKLKGQTDVTVTPQVSGQLMKICVTEGQKVSKGQTLFVIDQRNAQLELEAAQANLEAARAQENSAKLEYESNKNLFEKNIVSRYMLNNSENSYKQAKASFPNPDGHLFSGVQGTVVIPFYKKGAIVVPQVAVVKLQDKQLVYKVQADSTATAIDVTIQDIGNGQDFIVTSGLNVGDRIVTVGANNVQEGQRVLYPDVPKNE